MGYRRRSGSIARSAPRARFRLGLVASKGRCRRFVFGGLESLWDSGEGRYPRSRNESGQRRPNRRVTDTLLVVTREVTFEEPEIVNCIDQGDEVTADVICERGHNSALVNSSPVKEFGDGIERCSGGLEVLIHGVCAATQEDVVDAVRLVAKQFRHVHIHGGGTRRRGGMASRGGGGDHRGCRGRRVDWGGAA